MYFKSDTLSQSWPESLPLKTKTNYKGRHHMCEIRGQPRVSVSPRPSTSSGTGSLFFTAGYARLAGPQPSGSLLSSSHLEENGDYRCVDYRCVLPCPPLLGFWDSVVRSCCLHSALPTELDSLSPHSPPRLFLWFHPKAL